MDERAVIGTVRATGLLGPDAPVVVLLSGGRDSVCLLDVAVRLAGAGAVSALHVDYGLRESSPADAEHCASVCDALGIELALRRPTRPESGNLQAWARDVRYGAAAQIAASRGGARVATGHTATDQAETILYRLAASPGRRALLGMARRDGRLVRPLLGLARDDTEAYCRARGLGWRDDPTNDTDDYARGRVRGSLVPALRAIHPGAERNVLRTAELLRDEAAALDGLLDEVLAGRAEVELDRLATLSPALRRLVVLRLAEDAAGRLTPAAGNRVDELLALRGRPGSAAIDLPGGVRALVEYGTLRFTGSAAAPPLPVALPVPGRARFGDFLVTCEPRAPRPADGVLDAARLAPTLEVRPWRAGDRIAPLGLGGHKTLGDLFTDRRVPRDRRARVPVVVSGAEVAWVPGVATSERFAITGATTTAVRLHAEPARKPR